MPNSKSILSDERSEESKDRITTILLLGSGALKIGEAGEFDYSGSQAIKAFKEEGKRVILVNPNIATNQTSWGLADRVYFVPVTPPFVERVIAQERPDVVALGFGGQTALNCGLQMADAGVFERTGVRVLGTPIEAIRRTEDRALFKEALTSIGIPTPRSFCCRQTDEALRAAAELRYPVLVRGSFALGGKGSGRVRDEVELRALLAKTFVESPTVLIEEDLTGWKEIEYEVVRDGADNCITVCNMENVDPLGIHTGESIVVAPSQTLSNAEYQMLRTVAQRVVRHFGIVGECNIQYALRPAPEAKPTGTGLDPSVVDYKVIEVNARLSRSSALASKATGYPLAFVAAKIALGRTLPALSNAITRTTCADFEPALDYVALKMPRWDLQKFPHVAQNITSEMKSVGEVMALGRTFEEALQKAVRMLAIGAEGLFPHPFRFADIAHALACPTPQRLFAVADAFAQGWTVAAVAELTRIDPWFLERIQACSAQWRELCAAQSPLAPAQLRSAKRFGFSDAGIAQALRATAEDIRAQRCAAGIRPVIKQIDTLAGEFPAQTNYLYLTYHGIEHDVIFDFPEKDLGPRTSDLGKEEFVRIPKSESRIPGGGGRVVVLGSGPYSIGSSVEFDWCCMEAARELERQGYDVAMINSNPETVSTDYDECATLFFEELTEERVRDIAALFRPRGIVVSMGGQIPNSLAPKLARAGLPILGTDPANIDRAEDRHKFSTLLDRHGIDQPAWQEFSDPASAAAFAARVGYPVIVRPSYVLSGSAMAVVYSCADLLSYIANAARVGTDAPVVISKFEENAKEIEFDSVAEDGTLLAYAIGEHIEHAGVHSGDATIVLPPQRVTVATLRQMKGIGTTIANALHISGPFNIQFLAKENRLKVIECNLRASRTFPFVSKVTGVNFAQLAVQALLGIAPRDRRYQTTDLDVVAVKAPQFSFGRLQGADPRLGVEMASTGEVGCFGHTAEQALLMALLSTAFRPPAKNILFTIGALEDKLELLPSIRTLAGFGFTLFATQNTHAFLKDRDIPSALVYKISEPRQPNITEYIAGRRFDLIVNIPLHHLSRDRTDGYALRRLAADRGIPLLTNVQLVKRIVEAMSHEQPDSLPLLPWPDLLPENPLRATARQATLCAHG